MRWLVSRQAWRDQRGRWLGFLLIAAVNLYVFSPAFQHTPRADHLFYLGDMAGKKDWFSLAVKSYDFSRTRTFAPGDKTILRPFFLFFLGNELYFFKYDFVRWQVAGFLLHLFVIWQLLRLLWLIQKSVFAVLITLFFSLMYSGHDLVIWHHMNACMIPVALMLAAVTQALLYLRQGREPFWRIGWATFYLLIACFTYEIFNLFTILFYVFLCVSCPRDRKAWLRFSVVLLPCLLYLLMSVVNYVTLPPETAAAGTGFEKGLALGPIFKNMFFAQVFWIYLGLFPTQYQVVQYRGRAILESSKWLIRPLNWSDPTVLLAVLMAGIFVFFLWRGANRAWFRDKGRFWAFLLGVLFFWSFLISFFRIQNRGLKFALAETLTYPYIYWSFLVVCLYSLVDIARVRLRGWAFPARAAKILGAALLLFFAYVNAARVLGVNRYLAQEGAPQTLLVRVMEALVEDQEQDPQFSFYVDFDFPGNYLIPSIRLREGDDFWKRYSFIEMLFFDHYSDQTPQFVFVNSGAGPRVLKTR